MGKVQNEGKKNRLFMFVSVLFRIRNIKAVNFKMIIKKQFNFLRSSSLMFCPSVNMALKPQSTHRRRCYQYRQLSMSVTYQNSIPSTSLLGPDVTEFQPSEKFEENNAYPSLSLHVNIRYLRNRKMENIIMENTPESSRRFKS